MKAKAYSGIVEVEVPYTFFGVLALLDPRSTSYKYAVADVAAYSQGDEWEFASLGLSLEFNLEKLKKTSK